MSTHRPIKVLYEHPEWQQPLFAALSARGLEHTRLDLKRAAFEAGGLSGAGLYFNQASPSAYLRGNTRAVPLALAFLQELESAGADVINGATAFRFELSKASQVALMKRLGVDHPRSWVFNDPEALEDCLESTDFPLLVKPDQGGSGARMFVVPSLEELRRRLSWEPELWQPDNILLIQEYLNPSQASPGIVRLEFVGGELIYALRVISEGEFNLCPSDVCHPGQSAGPVFELEPKAPARMVEAGRTLLLAAGIEVGAIEYLETEDGRQVVYDINANSNLRRSLEPELGFDPLDRVVDYLDRRSASQAGPAGRG